MDIRHLDQIKEQDGPRRNRGLAPWLLGGVGVGAVVLAAVLAMPARQLPAQSTRDPLGELLARAKENRTEAAPADQLSHDHTSFAELLTDKERPSTALVAVKARDGRFIEGPGLVSPAGPPPGDELPVVPLPAGRLLESTKMTAEPRDGLTELAADRAQLPRGTRRAVAGSPGHFQIQVASFAVEAEADAYADELRLRGHSAYRESARIPGRGIWHRVRIGPFKDKQQALAYKAEFERKEGMTAMLVDPERAEQREAQRAAKLAARAKKSE